MPYNSSLCLQHSLFVTLKRPPQILSGLQFPNVHSPTHHLICGIPYHLLCEHLVLLLKPARHWHSLATAFLLNSKLLVHKVISTINLILNIQWPSTTFDFRCLLISCRGFGLHLYAVSEKSKGFIPSFKSPLLTYLLIKQECQKRGVNPVDFKVAIWSESHNLRCVLWMSVAEWATEKFRCQRFLNADRDCSDVVAELRLFQTRGAATMRVLGFDPQRWRESGPNSVT